MKLCVLVRRQKVCWENNEAFILALHEDCWRAQATGLLSALQEQHMQRLKKLRVYVGAFSVRT